MNKIIQKLLIVLFCTYNIKSSAKGVDTVRLYYPINVSNLTAFSIRTIDSLIYKEVLKPGIKMGIIGYADYLGSDTSNITLSENRANKVKAYLLHMGLKEEDIQIVIGKGEIERAGITSDAGYPDDRRVDIIPGGFKILQKPIVKQAPPKTAVKPLIDLSKVKKNETIRLNKIFFYPGSHKIREESVPYVDTLFMIMRDNPTLKVRIEGHICCLTGKNTDGYDYDAQDFRLSENRATQIYEILIEKGIDEERMEHKGFGKNRPLVWPEQDEDGENMNRRVEIRILEK